MKDPCVKCVINKFCRALPEDLSCEDVKKLWKEGEEHEPVTDEQSKNG